MINLKPYSYQSYQYLKMNWTELFSGTVMGGLISEIGRVARAYISTRKSTRKYFMDSGQLYEILTSTLANSPMDRWTIMMVHNGGNKLNVLTESFLTILWEDFDKGQKPRKQYYQKLPMDKSLLEYFRNAYLKGSAVADIDQVDDGTVLHSAMTLSDIKHSQIYFQVETKKALYFLSFSSTVKRFDELIADDRALIQMTVERTRGLLMNNAKYL